MTFLDPDDNLDGGALTVSGLLTEDRVGIRNQGSAAGEIGVSGFDVTYGGIVIGTFAGGDGSAFSVMLNADATSAAVEALIRNLTYADVSDAPTADRTLVLDVTDAGGANLGPVPPSITISVTAENDAPVIHLPDPLVIPEEFNEQPFLLSPIVISDDSVGGLITVTLDIEDGSLRPVDPDQSGYGTNHVVISGTLDFVNGQLRSLAYGAAPNAHGPRTLTVKVDDGGNVGAGGALSATSMLAIEILSVNDSPTGQSKTITLIEDGSYVLTAADFGFSDPADGDSFAGITISGVTASGALLLDSVEITSLTFVSASDIERGALVFRPDPDGNGLSYGRFGFLVQDDGGTDNGGVDTARIARTIRFDVTAANDAPVIHVPGDQTIFKDGNAVFTGAKAISIADVDAGSGLITVTLQSEDGTVFIGSNVNVQATRVSDTEVVVVGTLANVNAALDGATYAPPSDVTGTRALTISVDDGGNSGDGGALTDFETVIVEILPVNQPPTAANQSFTIGEDSVHTISIDDLGFIDPDGNGFAALEFLSSRNGSLLLDGAPIPNLTFVSAADIAAGRLAFQPDPNETGTNFNFSFAVQDDGGTEGGGQDTSVGSYKFSYTVTPVNDAPVLSGVGAPLAVIEGASPQLLYPQVVLADPEGNFAGGSLAVTGLAAGDQVSVRNDGLGAGQVGLGGGNVTFGGIVIGTLTGGAGTDFKIAFNAAATRAAVEAVIEHLTFAATGDDPAASRTLAIAVTDGDGASGGFAELTGAANPFAGIDVGDNAAVALLDYDGDGVRELFVGGADGFIRRYDLVGGVYQQLLGAANPFDGVDFGEDASPAFIDVNGDGRLDAIVGNRAGIIQTLYGTLLGFDPGAGPTGADSPFFGLSFSGGVRVGTGDIDGDGTPEVIVGHGGGAFTALGLSGGHFAPLVTDLLASVLLGRPRAGAFVDIDGDGRADLIAGDGDGKLAIFRNILSGFTPFLVTGTPLRGFTGGVSVAVDDFTGDGRPDAIVGTNSGEVRLLQNLLMPPAVTVTVTAVNDPPSGADGRIVTDEDSIHAITLADLGYSDPEGDALADLTVSGLTGAGALTLDGVQVMAGQVVVGADILAGKLIFTPAPDASGTDYAGFTFQLRDDGGTLDGGADTDPLPHTIAIDVAAVDDAAAARDDAFATDEATAIGAGRNLFDNNGSGLDADPDGPLLQIAAVNGTGPTGTQIVLPSGALLTVNADGTFSYDPNHAFDFTPAAGSGASNSPARDSFTYTLVGGGTATATIAIAGVDSNDRLFGTAGADVLDGGAGNDAIDGRAGADAMTGGLGNDLYFVDDGSDQAIEAAGGGRDKVYASVSYTLGVELEDLSIVEAGGARDGTGNGGANVLSGNGFANSLSGLDGADVLIGNGGDDILSGGLLADQLFGGAGKDTLDGGAGDDRMFGGTEDDSYFVDSARDQVVETASEGRDKVFASLSFSLAANVEDLELDAAAGISDGTGNGLGNVIDGNGFANRLYGLDGDDTLRGNGGGDVLTGGAGLDRLFGCDGNDALDGEVGDDTMTGGIGNDIYFIDAIGDRTIELGGEGRDKVYAFVSGYQLEDNVEDLSLMAAAGSATATGNGGNNVVTGNDFGNRLIGLGGDDVLIGKDGTDTLVGGIGKDLLQGGGGADGFLFDAAAGSANADRILDFSVADDTIELDHVVFTALSAGALSAEAFVAGTRAGDADDRIIYDAGTGGLYYDADGNGAGAAVQFAAVTAGTALTASDFFVI